MLRHNLVVSCVFLLLVLSIGVLPLMAEQTTFTSRQQVAETFLQGDGKTNYSIISNEMITNDSKGLELATVFHLKPQGYIVISSDDRIAPIIAFSDECNLDINDLDNPLVNFMIYDLNNRIEITTAVIDKLKPMKSDVIVSKPYQLEIP